MKSAVMEQEKREHRRRTIELEQHELQDVFLRAGEVPWAPQGRIIPMGGHGRPHFRLVKHYPLVNSHNYGKSPFSMGKSTISMAIFNSYVKLPEGRKFAQILYYPKVN